MPKKTKFRKRMKGNMKGTETRGCQLEFGQFGLQALEPAWITARQIEAARRVITRKLNVAVMFGLKYFLISLLLRNPLKPVWVKVKVILNIGLPLLNPAEFCLK